MRHPCPAILPWGVPGLHHLVAKLHLGVVHYAAHKGRVVLAANHQHLVILYHHIALQVLKDDHLVGTDIEEIVMVDPYDTSFSAPSGGDWLTLMGIYIEIGTYAKLKPTTGTHALVHLKMSQNSKKAILITS